MKCPKCGYQNSSEASYCNLCYEILRKARRDPEHNLDAVPLQNAEIGKTAGLSISIISLSLHIVFLLAQIMLFSNHSDLQIQNMGLSQYNSGPLAMVTYSFVHADRDHFVKNIRTYLLFGTVAAIILTPGKYLLLYFGSAITGGVVCLLLGRVCEQHYIVGASGVTRGFMGFVFPFLFHKLGFPYARYFKVFYFFVFVLLIGLDITGILNQTSDVAYTVHFSSLFYGLAFYVLYRLLKGL